MTKQRSHKGRRWVISPEISGMLRFQAQISSPVTIRISRASSNRHRHFGESNIIRNKEENWFDLEATSWIDSDSVDSVPKYRAYLYLDVAYFVGGS
uniref:Putative actin-related protein arp2/3 complex subunit arp2 n=1 Tax=Ixodes ricinus TaxID=34613 RepID=A0A0K8R5Z1_IXORI